MKERWHPCGNTDVELIGPCQDGGSRNLNEFERSALAALREREHLDCAYGLELFVEVRP